MPTPIAIENHVIGDVFTLPMWQELQGDLNYLLQQGADLASAATLTVTNEFHNVTGSVTINNITAGSLAGQRVELLFKAAITVSHNAGGTGNIRLVGNQDASLPANTSLSLRWDGISWWEVARATGSGVVSATTIAGLGAGIQGKQGWIRAMPATYANGAQVLPIATLTVGDTTGFASAGTLTTANGTITYTGKTATTFTGCTGGAGTLAANAAVVQATGTGAIAEFVPLVYDSYLGKWVSPPFTMPGYFTGTPVNGTWADLGPPNNTTFPMWGIHWRKFDAAGLKPQAKYKGNALGPGTTQIVQLRMGWRYGPFTTRLFTGGWTGTALPDANSAGAQFTASVGGNGDDGAQVFTEWGDIPAYTVNDILFPWLQSQGISGTQAGITAQGGFDVRWVG